MDARKRWLKYYIIGLMFGFAYVLLAALRDPEIGLGIGVVISLLFLVISWIPYHCAYRRPGTLLLFWQIILGFFSLVSTGMGLLVSLLVFAISLFKGGLPSSPFAELQGHPVVMLISFGLTIAWLFYLKGYLGACVDLRALNKRVKATPNI